jgi:phosphoribosylanthranilate isomerase
MRVKICGVRSRGDIRAAAEHGASYIGLVFYPPSPRCLSIADARWLVEGAPEGLTKVALTVDADDAALEALLADVPIDMLQLHGSESPRRVREVRERFGLPVMKAVGVSEPDDFRWVWKYARVADQLLIDAKPAPEAEVPGGSGVAFDWRLMKRRRWRVPWMLAGGLTPENVVEAVRLTGATQVDVSSGVERERGIKDHGLIAAFIAAALSAPPPRRPPAGAPEEDAGEDDPVFDADEADSTSGPERDNDPWPFPKYMP